MSPSGETQPHLTDRSGAAEAASSGSALTGGTEVMARHEASNEAIVVGGTSAAMPLSLSSPALLSHAFSASLSL